MDVIIKGNLGESVVFETEEFIKMQGAVDKAVSDLLDFDTDELGLPKSLLDMDEEDWDEVWETM